MRSIDRIRQIKMPRWAYQITHSSKSYPVIDRIIVGYVAVMLFFQVLLQIAPVLTFLTKTPLYSIQTYLGLLGGALIIVDALTTKRLWQGRYGILLYAILVLAALASIRMIGYGVKDNLFKLCWAAIQFALVYSCAFRLDRETMGKQIRYFFYVLLSIWFVACCVSLYQYVEQIGYKYVVNPLSQDASATRQGFYDSRLFGIFYTLNHAAYISLFFFLMCIVCIFKEKNGWVKAGLTVAAVTLLSHMILSVSRSAEVSLIACVTVMAWFLARKYFKLQGFRETLACLCLCLVVTAGCLLGYQGLKLGLSKVPYVRDMIVYYIHGGDESGEEEPQPDEDILEREELEEDTSNGRLSIWADYIALYDEVGLIGLSPGKYMTYILENHPELYIVRYVKEHYPDKYHSGIIYHVHNGYLMVYVSAGILGLLCILAFIILCVRRAVRMLLGSEKVDPLRMGAFVLVTAGAISAMFDEGLFFQNNPHTTMFWLALGILMAVPMEKTNQLTE